MKNKFFLILAIWLVMTGFVGCAGVTPEPNIAIDEVRTILVQDNLHAPDSMRIVTKIDYVDGKNNKRVVGQDLVLSAQKPANMRITISAFDKAVSTLVTDGSVFALMDVTQNVYLAGIASADNISQILPVYLSAGDLFRVIHGSYPKDDLDPENEKQAEIVWDGKNGGYRKSMTTRSGAVQDVYYAYPSWDIFKITVSQEDKTTYVYEASDFKEFTNGDKKYRYPKQIIFRLPQEDTNVRLRVESCDLDVEFSEAVFRLMPSSGARIIILDDLGVKQNATDSNENNESGGEVESEVQSGDLSEDSNDSAQQQTPEESQETAE